MFEWSQESCFWISFFENLKNWKNNISQLWLQRVPLWKKKWKFQKCILCSKILFFIFWIYVLHMLSFHLRYMTLIYLRFSNFNHFLLEILHFLPPSFISQYHQKQRLRNNAFGVNRHLKIKKARCKSFLGFSLSFDSFRVPKTHPGHNGPPTRVNVIPDHTGNRVSNYC